MTNTLTQGTRVKLAGSSALYYVLSIDGQAAYLVPNSANRAEFVDAANLFTVALGRLTPVAPSRTPLHSAWVAFARETEA